MKFDVKKSLNSLSDLDVKYSNYKKKIQKISKENQSMHASGFKSDIENSDVYEIQETIRERRKRQEQEEESSKAEAKKKASTQKKTKSNKKEKFLKMNSNEVLKGVIYSEILGEPKSLRRR